MCPLPPPLRLRQIRVAYSAAATAVGLPPATGTVVYYCSSGRRLVMAVLEAAKLEECRDVASSPSMRQITLALPLQCLSDSDSPTPRLGDALPLSRGLTMSALRAAWIPKCVLYHLRCACAKLQWRIPQPPLQCDYRRLQGTVGYCCSSGRRFVLAVLEAAKLQECHDVASSPSMRQITLALPLQCL
ncbi:hypothetical protein MRX96_014402 [Rhipicephalus microplus]